MAHSSQHLLALFSRLKQDYGDPPKISSTGNKKRVKALNQLSHQFNNTHVQHWMKEMKQFTELVLELSEDVTYSTNETCSNEMKNCLMVLHKFWVPNVSMLQVEDNYDNMILGHLISICTKTLTNNPSNIHTPAILQATLQVSKPATFQQLDTLLKALLQTLTPSSGSSQRLASVVGILNFLFVNETTSPSSSQGELLSESYLDFGQRLLHLLGNWEAEKLNTVIIAIYHLLPKISTTTSLACDLFQVIQRRSLDGSFDLPIEDVFIIPDGKLDGSRISIGVQSWSSFDGPDNGNLKNLRILELSASLLVSSGSQQFDTFMDSLDGASSKGMLFGIQVMLLTIHSHWRQQSPESCNKIIRKLDLLLAKVDVESLKWLFFCMSELAYECQDNVSVDQLDGNFLSERAPLLYWKKMWMCALDGIQNPELFRFATYAALSFITSGFSWPLASETRITTQSALNRHLHTFGLIKPSQDSVGITAQGSCATRSNSIYAGRLACSVIWQLDIKRLTMSEALQSLEEGRAMICKSKEGATYGKLSLWLAQVSERQEEKSPEKMKTIALFYIDALTYCQDTPGLIFKVVSYWTILSISEEACFPMLTEEMKKIPSHKFIPVIPQLCELLNFPEAGFKTGLMEILTRLSEDHPFHSVMTILYHAQFEPGIELSKQAGNPSNQSLQMGSREAAWHIIIMGSQGKKKRFFRSMINGYQEYMAISRLKQDVDIKIKKEKEQFRHLDSSLSDQLRTQIKANLDAINSDYQNQQHQLIQKLGTFEDKVPLLTKLIQVDETCLYNSVVYINRVSDWKTSDSGKSQPIILTCEGTDGHKYQQLVKSRDDIRQDSVIQQIFGEMNKLLLNDIPSLDCNLQLRTYQCIPISSDTGVLEFVEHTISLKQASMGDPYLKFKGNVQMSYIRSVATSSIAGYVVGLGDRHQSNILLDKVTGEVIHINFGIAFDHGCQLPVPEKVPFRLTKDIITPFGTEGLKGTFTDSCKHTLRVFRMNKDLILTMLEVFIFNPLPSWNSKHIPKDTQSEYNPTGDLYTPTTQSKMFISHYDVDHMDSSRVKMRKCLPKASKEVLDTLDEVKKKLADEIDVGAHVEELISQATSPQNLAVMYPGWMGHQPHS